MQVYELITCVRRANENAGNLISGVQFLINVYIYIYIYIYIYLNCNARAGLFVHLSCITIYHYSISAIEHFQVDEDFNPFSGLYIYIYIFII